MVAGVLFWLTGCDQTNSQVSISRVEATGCDRPQQRIGIGTVIRSAAGYTTGLLAPGESEIIVVRMTADSSVTEGASKNVTIRVFRGGVRPDDGLSTVWLC